MLRPHARFLICLLPVFLALAAIPAHADVLELQDGRLVEGIVVEDGDLYLVHSRFGVAEIAKDQVKRRTEAKTLDAQIREHLAGLSADDAQNRALMAGWLTEIGRTEEAHAVAQAALEIDPESARAHEVLGHIRHRGVWCTPDEAKKAEGLEKHGDRWYTADEWKSLGESDRMKALEAERRAQAREVNALVNRAVRLMLSPNEGLRERGRKMLETLSAELDNPRYAELARNVDAYVEKLHELEKAVASAAARAGGAGHGVVLGEIRATVSKLKRPIQTFETSLGSNIGGAPVKIQLPELEVIKVRTVAPVPVVVR